MNCEWGDWATWTTCTATCGLTRQRLRVRIKTVVEMNCGSCDRNDGVEYLNCALPACPIDPNCPSPTDPQCNNQGRK